MIGAMTGRKLWRAALAALGITAMSHGAKPTPAAKEVMGRCQRYSEDGRGYEFMQKTHDAQLRFAFDLHRKIVYRDPNRLTSPLSAYAVMAMLAGGANGATLEELKQVLFGALSVPEGIDGVAATFAKLECPDEYRSTTFTAGNRLFFGKDVDVLPAYSNALKHWFNGTTGKVDFAKAKEAAAEINKWVSDETRGNIKDLIDPKAINADMRLILVNALYLLGTWAEKFDVKNTKSDPFHLENGNTVKVPTMHQRHEYPTFLHAKRPTYEALVMNLADHLVDVVFLLPAQGTKLSEVVSALDATEWGILEKQFDKKPVELALPKFNMSGGGSLVDALKALGVRSTFIAGKADFNGIDGGKNLLFVGAVIQRTTAKVDELGFEGSAATAAMMFTGSAPSKPAKPIPFVVDRPFAFVAMHRGSGAVLFVGEVRDPR